MSGSETTSGRGVKRLLVMVLAGGVATAALAGCSPGPATKAVGAGGKAVGTTKGVEEVLTHTKNIGSAVSHAHPNPGTVHDAAAGLAELSDDVLGIKAKFDRIAASDDPFGEALVIASCSGLTEVANRDRESGGSAVPPTAQQWEAYLNNRVASIVAPQYAGLVSTRVNQFNTSAQLASINPRAAHVYVEACVLGRR